MGKTLAARLVQSRLARAGGLVAAGVVGASQALAEVSTSATQAAAAVTSTQADLTLVWAGVLTLVIAIWGIYKVVKIFGSK